jgi:RND superfamily putative drug exporter
MNPLRPLARFVVNHPLYVIAFWMIAAVGIVYSAPSLASVTNSDQSSFLPKSSEFSKANNLAQHMFPGSTNATATFVFSRRDGGALTSTDQQTVSAVTADLRAARLKRVAAVATNPSLLSPNRQVQLATVVLTGKSGDKANDPAVKPLRNEAARLLRGTPLVAGLMGDAATQADSDAASQSGQMITMLVTIFLILALVGIIFRSPIAAVFPIAAIILVYTLAQSAIGALATMLHFQVGTLLGYLLIVVLFGIGTDYILFLLFRYRERLRAGDSSKRALMVAVERVGKVVASSALVVITAFMTLLLAQLGFLRSLGPGLSIGVGLMLLAALTPHTRDPVADRPEELLAVQELASRAQQCNLAPHRTISGAPPRPDTPGCGRGTDRVGRRFGHVRCRLQLRSHESVEHCVRQGDQSAPSWIPRECIAADRDLPQEPRSINLHAAGHL